ncbi:MAG TPA: 3-hydroxyacyl-CoA dehydrogenase NAD-binding domain-containing protein [bacterium]|nr:3-hydroxyacyl-CoA dehydrogenase NAD-binding domain-containing protein [bacterium]
MSKQIKKVAVLGSGVMGCAIACHLANCGIPSLMLDIVLPLSDEEKAKGVKKTDPAFRNKLSAGAMAVALKAKQPMAPLYVKSSAALIQIGNFEDDMEKIADCDWVIEVVKEDMKIKQGVFKQVAKYWKPGMIVTSNTSGLPITEMSKDMPAEMKKHFFVTHFFNPVRHMKLLEIIPGELTDKKIMDRMAEFGERVLGKGIVYGKDTPNFVANRIGMYAIMKTIAHMEAMELRIDEIDAIAGPPMGRPKSAAFRTADLVGLDTFCHVSMSVYNLCPNDEERDVFNVPAWINEMVKKGWLGNKSKQGFYKKGKGPDGKKMFEVVDYKTGEYIPSIKPDFASVKGTKKKDTPAEKVKALLAGDDKASAFAWKVLRDVTIYSCNRIPEIADDVVNIDNAMKWGFAWDAGPFETADAIGLKDIVKRMKDDGVAVPELLDKAAKAGGFYKKVGLKKMYFCAKDLKYKEAPLTALTLNEDNLVARLQGAIATVADPASLKIKIADLKDRGNELEKNAGASIYDMGDGVALLEFHSYKGMNPIDADIIAMMMKTIDVVQEKGFSGVVVGNEGTNFSVGANLLMLLMESRNKNWTNVELASKTFQDANMLLKYAPFPVVTAPFQMVLGGGCEATLHGDAVCAAAETYIGLVEVGVGVIPAGGGCKEYLVRNLEAALSNPHVPSLFPFVRRAFENIAMAKVCMNAYEAVENNIFRPTDHITVNRDYLLSDAKQMVLGMVKAGYTPKSPRKDIRMIGSQYYAAFKNAVWTMRQGNYISEHDALITDWVAKILTGGDIPGSSVVDEQYVLDLEREAFVSLCGTEKTQDRMQYMLQNNKPLRN